MKKCLTFSVITEMQIKSVIILYTRMAENTNNKYNKNFCSSIIFITLIWKQSKVLQPY